MPRHRYVPMLRRRREGKTSYHKRRKAIASKRDLLVIRVGCKNITVQVIRPEIGGDRTLVSSHSRELFRLGWKGSPKSTPAAYLLGLLTGLKAKAKGLDGAILYMGIRPFVRGSRVSAVVKGLIDSGFHVPCSDDVMPGEERIRGRHIAEYARMLDHDEYERRFSRLLERGMRPEEYEAHFEEVKSVIMERYGR